MVTSLNCTVTGLVGSQNLSLSSSSLEETCLGAEGGCTGAGEPGCRAGEPGWSTSILIFKSYFRTDTVNITSFGYRFNVNGFHMENWYLAVEDNS